VFVHQVSEPITEASFYLVCKVSYDCVRRLLLNIKFESSMDILTMKGCWMENKVFQQDYPSTFFDVERIQVGAICL
jgi:hypothetical protein